MPPGRGKRGGEGAESFVPAYQNMAGAERKARAAALKELLAGCRLCPRRCGVDRLRGEMGACGAAGGVPVASAGPHFGEERELVGAGGSGTIFFYHCNLACIFCQNHELSRAAPGQPDTGIDGLASLMLSLQRRGCSNINLVSPTPFLYQIVSALDKAASEGLNLPLVYNCGGYESLETLSLLRGLVDIYMPDAKYGDDDTGELCSGVPDYFSRLGEALVAMQSQVGDLIIDPDGLTRRGLLVRHLVLPGGLAGSAAVARFLAEKVSPHCAVNVMGQYYPAYRASAHPSLTRRPTSKELMDARDLFREAGLRLL